MANMHVKIYSTSLVLGICKLELQCDTATHRLEWLKTKTDMQHRKVCSNWNSSLLVRIQSGILENSFTVTYKVKHTIKIQPYNSIHSHLLSEIKTCVT